MIELDAMRLPQRRSHGECAIAGESGLPGPRDGRDRVVARVDAAYDVIHSLDHEDVAASIEADLVGLVQLGKRRMAPVPRVPFLAGARDSRDLPVRVDLADDVVHGVANVQPSVGSARDSERVVQPGGCGRPPVAGISALTGLGKGRS